MQMHTDENPDDKRFDPMPEFRRRYLADEAAFAALIEFVAPIACARYNQERVWCNGKPECTPDYIVDAVLFLVKGTPVPANHHASLKPRTAWRYVWNSIAEFKLVPRKKRAAARSLVVTSKPGSKVIRH